MPDTRILIAGLEDYHTSLGRHVIAVAEEFDFLNRAWDTLSECYQGTAAEEFGDLWQRTEERFLEYTERTKSILRTLDDKIKDVRHFDLADTNLLQ